ncbi:MAG TPA: MgtC/SapB family protein [Chloroflexota bacterium]|nr:MgtC/SapB family protein [Chloroflexota bacterium]
MELIPSGPWLEITGRLVLALILGATVGLERELRRSPAGLRTFTMLSLGACVYMLVSLDTTRVDGVRGDPGRVAAQVVTGIGFLGGGVLFRAGESVRGLTTAAGLWASAALGLAAGAGLYFIAIMGAVLMLFVFHGLWLIEQRYETGEHLD